MKKSLLLLNSFRLAFECWLSIYTPDLNVLHQIEETARYWRDSFFAHQMAVEGGRYYSWQLCNKKKVLPHWWSSLASGRSGSKLCGLYLSPVGKVSLLPVFAPISSATAAKSGVLCRTGGCFLYVLVNFIAQTDIWKEEVIKEKKKRVGREWGKPLVSLWH